MVHSFNKHYLSTYYILCTVSALIILQRTKKTILILVKLTFLDRWTIKKETKQKKEKRYGWPLKSSKNSDDCKNRKPGGGREQAM